MTSTVVFDIGDVLCHFDPEARVRALATASDWTVDAVRDHVWGSGRDARADAGELTEDDAFAAAGLDGALDRAAVLSCWAQAFVRDAAVLALIDRLSVRAAVLTNNGPVLEGLFAGHLAPIALRCSPILLSWRLRATKPSREVFDRASVALGADPSELLLVDDQPRNVNGAKAAGWDGIVFTGVDALAAELRARNLTSE
jgi:HAD superfamily hydrolase (TIGR01509 family)